MITYNKFRVTLSEERQGKMDLTANIAQIVDLFVTLDSVSKCDDIDPVASVSKCDDIDSVAYKKIENSLGLLQVYLEMARVTAQGDKTAEKLVETYKSRYDLYDSHLRLFPRTIIDILEEFEKQVSEYRVEVKYYNKNNSIAPSLEPPRFPTIDPGEMNRAFEIATPEQLIEAASKKWARGNTDFDSISHTWLDLMIENNLISSITINSLNPSLMSLIYNLKSHPEKYQLYRHFSELAKSDFEIMFSDYKPFDKSRVYNKAEYIQAYYPRHIKPVFWGMDICMDMSLLALFKDKFGEIYEKENDPERRVRKWFSSKKKEVLARIDDAESRS